LRKRKQQVVRLSAPDDTVYARSDVGRAGTGLWIVRGTPVSRDHPYVKDLPHEFEVRYPLHLERGEEVTDGS
jgi:hypothetical protein